MARDCRARKQQEPGCGGDRQTNRDVKQDPVDQHRGGQENTDIELNAKYCDGPQAEWKNRPQKQNHDADHVQGAVHRVAMVFHVVRKLTPKKCIHFALVPLDRVTPTQDDMNSAVQTMPDSSSSVSRSCVRSADFWP